jgi:hypothetical protein
MKRLPLMACIALIALVGMSSFSGSFSVTPAYAATQGSASEVLTSSQREVLFSIARQTWRFFDAATDPTTHLPMDNIGLYDAPARGTYTSATNIGVYFWSVVAAQDLGLITREQAFQRVNATLTTVEKLKKWHGLLLGWYDTTNGHHITGPGGTDIEDQPVKGAFISTVDNGWFASGLILLRQVFPELKQRASALLDAMDLALFYDNRDQSTDITAGQMYGGYLAEEGPAGFHYGLLNSETRIAAYMGIGTRKMPGDVWWRTWRTLPADFTWQGQPPQGSNVTYRDPRSGKRFTVFEGHYTSNGINFVPSWGGSMFEGLMNNLIIPETIWGPRGFGLNDRRYVQAQIAYARQTLQFPVWGLSPASTPDDTGGYGVYGARGLASNSNCCPYEETAVTPHASFLALDVSPQEAFKNIQELRSRYPSIYDRYGFFDAVDPITGKVGHRYLVLDQAMIMAALDNALRHRQMQRHFSRDPVILANLPYLAIERFSI